MIKKTNGIYYVSGKIDTATVETFSKELEEAFKEESVVLDFSDVEYISSSGLRVILELCKSCKSFSIINTKNEVYDIFEITGFTEMMSVSKKLRELSVEGCELVGKGGSGTVYRVSDDMIVKVFNPGTSINSIKAEREFAKNAFVLGLPTAIPFDIVKVGDCYGACFELLNAISLGKAFQLYPERYEELLDKYLELIRKIQNIEDTQGKFRNIKDILLERIESQRGLFPDDVVDMAAEATSSMPDSNTLVHGDLHTGNILVHNDELLVIDMADLTTGPKYYDVLCLYRDFYNMPTNPLSKDMSEGLLDLPNDMAIELWYRLAKRIFKTEDDAKIQKIMDVYELLIEVNNVPMTSNLPLEVLKNMKDYLVMSFNSKIPANIDIVKEGYKNL